MNKIFLLLISFFLYLNANIIQLSPLTAIIKDNHIKDAIITINSKDDKEIPLIYKVTNKTIKQYGGIPVFGLYEDFDNKIDVEYKSNNEIKKDTYYLKTQKILDKKIEVNSNDIKFSNRFYFIVDKDSAFIVDTIGNIRWFANIDKTNFIEKPNKNMYLFNDMAFDIINGKTFMFNIQDDKYILNSNDNIFIINKSYITRLDKSYKILNKWQFPLEVSTFDNISSLYYSDGLFISYKDSIIKLNKKSEVDWILGGYKNSFKLVDATGSKTTCDNCRLTNVENVQKIDFLSNKDIIYIVVFDNDINAKALMYKIDEKLFTNEILWQYKIKDEILNGNVFYKDDFHSIFINYKDIKQNLHILEFVWGEITPTIDITIDDSIKSSTFNIKDLFN